MEFAKPAYNAQHKVHVSDIKEGFRCESELEDSVFYPPLASFLEMYRETLIQVVLQQTKGWFSKPLTAEWLRTRLFLDIPTDSLEDFEGTVEWQAKKLSIAKDKFTVHLAIVSKKALELIDLMESIESAGNQPEEVSDLPLTTEQEECIGVGPTRRRLMKEEVLEARAKAARALFKAERLTIQYCEIYGEDTDWEEDSDSESEDSFA